jgi:hypothetical protein
MGWGLCYETGGEAVAVEGATNRHGMGRRGGSGGRQRGGGGAGSTGSLVGRGWGRRWWDQRDAVGS